MSYLPTCPCLLPALVVRGEAIMCRAPGKQLRARVLLWTQLELSQPLCSISERIKSVSISQPLKQLSSSFPAASGPAAVFACTRIYTDIYTHIH